jgi:hypothetical protein
MSVADNAPGGPQTISVAGTGTVVQLNPASLNFGFPPPCAAATRTTQLTNVGSATLSIIGITITGYFTQTNNCNSSVTPGQSCTITVTFPPYNGSPRPTFFGNVSISDDGGGSPQVVPLSGTREPCLGP